MAPAGCGVDWENRYRLGDTPWEKGAAHPALIAWLRENCITGRVFVPGCGFGHDVRALAAGGAEVTGLDLAPSPLVTAKKFPRAGNEQYVLGDLFDLPKKYIGAFDWVFEHTCFCAIDPSLRQRYVESVAAILKPGGRLLAIFFINPDNEEDGPPYGCSVEELDALFSKRFKLAEQWIPARTYEGRENRELMQLFALK